MNDGFYQDRESLALINGHLPPCIDWHTPTRSLQTLRTQHGTFNYQEFGTETLTKKRMTGRSESVNYLLWKIMSNLLGTYVEFIRQAVCYTTNGCPTT